MSKKVKIIIVSILLVGITLFAVFNYVIYGGARNLSTEQTDFTVSSQSISKEFVENIEASNEKYLEKAVAIKGKITKITGKEVIIDNSISCTLKDLDSTIKENQIIILKGRVVGYDDLMGELKLDQCLILK
jgi:hypothetical protein